MPTIGNEKQKTIQFLDEYSEYNICFQQWFDCINKMLVATLLLSCKLSLQKFSEKKSVTNDVNSHKFHDSKERAFLTTWPQKKCIS